MKQKNILGLTFSFLWSTSAIAMKIGILSVEPLVLAVIRFLLAGVIMILISNWLLKEKIPKGIAKGI